MSMEIERSKNIGNGGTARIESWYDSVHRKKLYRVMVNDSDGAGLRLPRKLIDGTREKVERIFDAISPQDTLDTIENREDELNRL